MDQKMSYNKVSNIIKTFFKEDEWDNISVNEQNYYLTYLSNPNHFFFRSSFLNEKPVSGEFSDSERSFFVERLNYFRNELRIQKIPWGFFSLPFSGRAGYQCAWFYRENLISKKFETDPYYPIVNNVPKNIFDESTILLRETLQTLEKEVFSYVSRNISHVNLEDYSQKPPAYAYQEIPTYRTQITSIKVAQKGLPQKKRTGISSSSSSNILQEHPYNNDEISQSSQDTSKHENTQKTESPKEQRMISDHKQSKEIDQSTNSTSENKSQNEENTISSKEDQNENEKEQNGQISKEDSDRAKLLQEDAKTPIDPNNPLIGFNDPLTHTQIKEPMLDINGFVMGKKSWEYCLNHKEEAPCEMSITCLDDLIALTKENYESMKSYIVNA